MLAECCRVPVHGEVEGVEEGRKHGPGSGWLAAQLPRDATRKQPAPSTVVDALRPVAHPPDAKARPSLQWSREGRLSSQTDMGWLPWDSARLGAGRPVEHDGGSARLDGLQHPKLQQCRVVRTHLGGVDECA